jgi:hypothetical protein
MTRFNPPNEFELLSEPATAKSLLVSAADVIDGKLPPELQDLAERIKVSLKKADNYYISVGQYLAEAKKLCDEEGFEAFRDRFCPNVCRSRIFELLGLASGNITLEDLRAKNAERKRKQRARQKRVRDVTDSRPTAPVVPTPAVIDAVSALVNRPYSYTKAKATGMVEAAARNAGEGAEVATLLKLALKAQAKPSPDIPVEQDDRPEPAELTPEEKSAQALRAFVGGFEAICEYLPDMNDGDRDEALTFVADQLNIFDEGE